MLKCQLNFLMTIEIFLTEIACEGLQFDRSECAIVFTNESENHTKKSTSTIVTNANNCIES